MLFLACSRWLCRTDLEDKHVSTINCGLSLIFEPSGTQRHDFLQPAARTDRSVCCTAGNYFSDYNLETHVAHDQSLDAEKCVADVGDRSGSCSWVCSINPERDTWLLHATSLQPVIIIVLLLINLQLISDLSDHGDFICGQTSSGHRSRKR